jgi:hypothetical protein
LAPPLQACLLRKVRECDRRYRSRAASGNPYPFDVASVVNGIAEIETAHGPIAGLVQCRRVRQDARGRACPHGELGSRDQDRLARHISSCAERRRADGQAAPRHHRQCRFRGRHDVWTYSRLYRRQRPAPFGSRRRSRRNGAASACPSMPPCRDLPGRNPLFAKHSGVACVCPGRNQDRPQAVDG